MRPMALVSLLSLFIFRGLFQELLLEFGDVVLNFVLGQDEVAPFEVRFLDEEHEQKHCIDGVRHSGGNGCSRNAILGSERESTDEGGNQPAKCRESVHLITSGTGIIVSKDKENAVKQDAWREDADEVCHLAEVRTKDEDIELRWQQA